ncbi:hypothetical protein KJI95_08805 [Shewanella sp. JM162201]|uniref:Uncharacterized protein n=1 Tax=Shewanella jiangmenensis TaxID=2837387 RepID=A0ABS5V2D5_9GAMM|nr:hypothetical protein [Shewanella jiangmenensis]MBT1444622.1 hypothetical protein [Shewanella jiangmenensis]
MEKSAYLDVMGISRWQQRGAALPATANSGSSIDASIYVSIDKTINASVDSSTGTDAIVKSRAGSEALQPALLASLECLLRHPLCTGVYGSLQGGQLHLTRAAQGFDASHSGMQPADDIRSEHVYPLGELGSGAAKKALWQAIVASGVL